ncbi:MAG: 50S ribosomal protein L25/general stress protein Ctc [Acidobacteriota bacterium]|nr:50S ribosomal protein L25/general stress protein Ctc [Blastocatellia bacterium]MDW8413682.1 50S ribosomal protein L25/general stress protein Ctc [Acidobacteriota bacterium]
MISDIIVKAVVRTKTGSAESRRLRRRGLIPATVYGDHKAPVSVAVEAKQITFILRSESGHNTIFKLQTEDKETTTVIIKDWQLDPVKGKLIHADFYRVSMTEKTRVKVPIHLVGEPFGVKNEGGLLDHPIREIEIECLPTEIPEHIDVDISRLRIGDHIYAKDVKLPAGIRLLTSPEQAIAAILGHRVSEALTTATSEPAEPEVIKKGKVEKEE